MQQSFKVQQDSKFTTQPSLSLSSTVHVYRFDICSAPRVCILICICRGLEDMMEVVVVDMV